MKADQLWVSSAAKKFQDPYNT